MDHRLLYISPSLFLAALVPFGAAAQVSASDHVVLERESEDGTEYTLNGSEPTGDGIVNEWTADPAIDLENADMLTPTGVFPVGLTVATFTSTADHSAERTCGRSGCEAQIRRFTRYRPACRFKVGRPWKVEGLDSCSRCRWPVASRWRFCACCGKKNAGAMDVSVRRKRG
jgi:hypothetical protein